MLLLGHLINDGNGIEDGHVRVYDNFMVGTNELLSTMIVSIYPNPTKATITIKGGIQDVKIRNTKGQLIRGFAVNDKQISIDLSNQPKGIYLIHVTTDKGATVKKVVIE